MLLIYSHTITNRLKYIFKTIFVDVLLVKIEFTTDVQFFENFEGVKINYSDSKLNTGLFFQTSRLLFENTIQKQKIELTNFEGKPSFFSVGNDALFPFDVFAASFYLISRYEEYLPHKQDVHERFLGEQSLAVQHNFIEEPLVNYWINHLVEIIENAYPNFKFPNRTFEFVSTLDIDNAYAYQHKGFVRTIGALTKALLKGNNFSNRLKVLFGNSKDPYDTFDYQTEIHTKYNISPIYFFLIGDYGKYDKNIPYNNKTFQNLIQSVSKKNEIGIHPSYASNNNSEKIGIEKDRLHTISKKEIKQSRQHYLKLNLPKTYNNLIENKITVDHTMGYAEYPGFRASICSPYYFYNLEQEKETSLQLFPFTTMEATFQYYQKSSPEKALEKILELMQKVKNVSGTFISVWHNESLSNEGIWKGWKIVYEKMLKESQNKD